MSVPRDRAFRQLLEYAALLFLSLDRHIEAALVYGLLVLVGLDGLNRASQPPAGSRPGAGQLPAGTGPGGNRRRGLSAIVSVGWTVRLASVAGRSSAARRLPPASVFHFPLQQLYLGWRESEKMINAVVYFGLRVGELLAQHLGIPPLPGKVRLPLVRRFRIAERASGTI